MLPRRELRLILLDRALRAVRQTDLCGIVKSKLENASIPVIALAANDSVADRIRAFEDGVDDYIRTPCDPREVSMRVQAVLRQSERWTPARLVVGPVAIDCRRNVVSFRGGTLTLTETETRLLTALAKRAGVPQDRNSLLMEVWGKEADIHRRTVDTCIRRLRTKLGKEGDLIQTVRGGGYCFVGGAASKPPKPKEVIEPDSVKMRQSKLMDVRENRYWNVLLHLGAKAAQMGNSHSHDLRSIRITSGNEMSCFCAAFQNVSGSKIRRKMDETGSPVFVVVDQPHDL